MVGQVAIGDGGTFAAHGLVEPGRYRLAVHADDLLPHEPLEFAPGTHGLALALHRGAGVAMSILLDDERLADALTPEVEPHDPAHRQMLAAGQGWTRRIGAVARDAASTTGAPVVARTFRWTGLPAGHHDIVVRMLGREPAVHRVRDVELVAGATAEAIVVDLRHALPVAALRLVGRDGEAIAGGWVVVGNTEDAPFALQFVGDRLELPVPEGRRRSPPSRADGSRAPSRCGRAS